MRRYLVLVLIAAGCYSPSYDDCQVSCLASQVCPSGLECDGTMCRHKDMIGTTCPTPDAAGRDAPTSRLTIETLHDARVAALCDYAVRCGQYDNAADCVLAIDIPIFRRDFADLVAAVAASKVMFDPVKSQECIDRFATLSCDRDVLLSTRGRIPACLVGTIGTVAEPGACALNEECVSQYCQLGNCPAGTCCQGTCIGSGTPAQRTLTERCSRADLCIDSYCDLASANEANHVCASYKQSGTLCNQFLQECAPGLQCKDVGAGMTQCTPLQQTGQMCSSNNDCLRLSDVCSGQTQQCVQGGLGGFSCSAAFGNQGCQTQYYCNSNQCELLPTVPQPCNATLRCRGGYCDGVICVDYKVNGSPCAAATGNLECESGYCNSSSSMCETQPVCI